MENEIESKKEVEETTIPTDSPETKETTQPADGTAPTTDTAEEEQVTIPKSQLEKISKKAADFDGLINSNRGKKMLDKLKAKQPEDDDGAGEYRQPEVDIEEVSAVAARVAEETANKILLSGRQDEFKQNLNSAYDEWIAENPWANDDGVMQDVISNLRPATSAKKEDLLNELDRAALLAHPRLYKESIENKIKSKILVEQSRIDVGSGGSAPSVVKQDVPVDIKKEDRDIADKFFGGDLERYLKVRNK
jgi:hypothetical protein